MRWRLSFAVSLAFAAMAAGTAAPSLANGFIREIKLGALAHDVDGLWSGFSRESEAVDLNGEVIFSPSLPFLWGAIRPALGGTINFQGDTSHAYLDARWEIETPSGVFFATGIGAAVHTGDIHLESPDRKALGSRVLLHVPLEVGVRLDEHHSFSVYFEHLSNANLADENEGIDYLGARYGYRF
nr:MAG: acyloxyacyl hydrolase [Pseudomonadota bacterium]